MSRLIKRLFLFFSLFLCVVLGTQLKDENPITKKMKRWFSPKKEVLTFAVREHHPFVIIIPSYNNAEWVEKNLRSVFDQKYDQYRVIYIDDASNDGTFQKAHDLISQYQQSHRFTVLHNEKNQGAVENFYRAIHSCQDHEIVVTLDGDDWFAHDRVLEKLNEYYADPDVWLTYGSYIEYPCYSFKVANFARPLPEKIIEKNEIRKFSKEHWVLSHLRTFYAGLGKKIQLQDLLYEGKYLDSACDVAFMIPLSEMAAKHARHIDEVLCIYNRASCLNDTKMRAQRQRALAYHILDLPSYAPLDQIEKENPLSSLQSDLIIFSFDRPLQLYALLESIEKYCAQTGQVTVIGRFSDEDFKRAYSEVAKVFTNVRFVMQSEDPQADFKPLVLQALKDSSSEFIAFAVDDNIVTDSIDFSAATRALNQTGAFGFFFRLGEGLDYCYMKDCPQQMPPLARVNDEMYAWSFKEGTGDWDYLTSVDMSVYRKSDLLLQLEPLSFSNPNSLESEWDKKVSHRRKIGLCYHRSKVVNVPLNQVNVSTNRVMQSYDVKELLMQFNNGLKMDIAPLERIKNCSAHMDYEPTFIPRTSTKEKK